MLKVLICDDDDLLLELLTFKLERRGFDVVCASDGKEALDVARSQSPDIIILDAMMPVMNGFEALTALKAESSTANIPVLMLTARRQEKDILAGLKMGARDYLVKPFIPEELLARIETILQNSGEPDALLAS